MGSEPTGDNVPDELSNAGEADDSEAPEEQAIDQRIVPFMGDELAAALTTGGSIFISLSGMCGALGLSLNSQMRRIKRTRVLASGMRRISLKTSGGAQRVNCVRLDKIALWLAGIQTTLIKPAFRSKIETYQDELAPVATQIFMRVMGLDVDTMIPASAPPEAHALADQIDMLTDVTNLLREHLMGLIALPDKVEGIDERLQHAIAVLKTLAGRQDEQDEHLALIDERTQRLTPVHARDVKDMIDEMVRQTRHTVAPLTYIIIYGRLKRRFHVATYKEIGDDRYVEVVAYLREELRKALNGEQPEQTNLF